MNSEQIKSKIISTGMKILIFLFFYTS